VRFQLESQRRLLLVRTHLPPTSWVPTGREAALRAQTSDKKKGFSIKEQKYFVFSILAIPACFWIIVITQLLQAGAVNSYKSNLADAISVTRDAAKEAAGYTSALGQGGRRRRPSHQFAH
jgi:hypothetical protein